MQKHHNLREDSEKQLK